MCEYCENEKHIFDFQTFDDFVIKLGGKISDSPVLYDDRSVFIDRGFLRLVHTDDCGCMDHGEKVKIDYCPFCADKLMEVE